MGLGESPLDETRAAERTASALGTDHHALRMDCVDQSQVELALKSSSEPFADAAMIPTFLLSKEASNWVKVVLTGEGADELFGGYARYRYQHRLRHVLGAPHVLRRIAATSLEQVGRTPLERYLPARPPDVLGAPVAMQPREWRAVLPRSLRLGLFPLLTQLLADPIINAVDPKGDQLAYSLATDLATSVPEDLLVKVDRTTMAWGLEARPPFLDHLLVESVLALDARERWRPEMDKALLREYALKMLPRDIALRRKQSFLTPTRAWLIGPLAGSYALAREALLDNGIDRATLLTLERRSLGRGADNGRWAWVLIRAWVLDTLQGRPRPGHAARSVMTGPASKAPVHMIIMGYGSTRAGGAENQAALLAGELHHRGRRVAIVAPSATAPSILRSDDEPRLVRLPSLRIPKTRTASYLASLTAYLLTRPRADIGIVHTHLVWYHTIPPAYVRLIDRFAQS